MITFTKHTLPAIFLGLLILPATAAAGNFRLFPAKQELTLEPGASAVREIKVTNNLGRSANFRAEASNIGDADKPAYFLRDYLTVEPASFSLPDGGEQVVKITISLPAKTPPGSLAGAVLIRTDNGLNDSSNARVATRIGATILVKVEGEVRNVGRLKNFDLLDYRPLESGPVRFRLTYTNTGNSYLNPFGVIEIKNIFGQKQVVAVDPWYVLPESARSREVVWKNKLGFGLYSATLSLNRGYSKIVDQETIYFWITPWPIIVAIFIIFLIIFSLIISRRRRLPGLKILVAVFLAGIASVAGAYVASSPNYRIQSDSINFAGDEAASSTNYHIIDTMGEIGTDNISSVSEVGKIGYRAMQETYLAVTAPADVTLSPSINGRQGQGGGAHGSVGWNVVTDDAAGYSLGIAAATSPALQSSNDSFADYGTTPTYSWTVAADKSYFGFTATGDDVVAAFKSSGSTCGAGTADGSHCWRGFSLTDAAVAQSSAANQLDGVTTTVKLLAEVGSDKLQNYGSYVAQLTVTVLAL